MAYTAYLSILAQQQGLLSAGCNTKDSVGNRAQLSHRDEITVLASSFSLDKHSDSANVIITKPVDKSSPLLGNAFSRQEHLQCTIELYRTNEQGFNENFYSIELVDALITHISFIQPNVLSSGDEEMSEELHLSYRDLIFRHKISGTVGYHRWE